MRNIDDIIADYLSGEHLPADELSSLETWRRESGNEEKLLIYQSRLREGKEVRTQFLAAPGLPFERIKATVQGVRRRQRMRRWYQVAAGLLILVGLGLLFTNPGKGKPDGGNPAEVSFAAIAPGTPKAELVLGNGLTVQLQPQEESVIMSDSLLEIRNSGNTVSYTVQGEPAGTSMNTLNVPPGAEYSIVLSDGTKVYMNSASALRFPSAFTEETREVYLSGEAFFEVATDHSRKFLVHTEALTLRVLGTSFNVKSYPGQPLVTTTLVEGRLQVSHAGENHDLTPGFQAVYEKESGKTTVNAVETALYTSWKDGYYYFKQMPLEEIMTTLSLWYNLKLHYEDEAVKYIRFSGRLQRFDEITYLLDKFEETGTIAYVIHGNTITITKK